MRIYVAGKIGAENGPSEFMRVLEERGHTISFDWTQLPHLKPYAEHASDSAEAAIAELMGVATANLIVMLVHPRGVGMYVELGAALMMSKQILAVYEGDPPSMFLMHPRVQHVSTTDEALALIDRWDEEGRFEPPRRVRQKATGMCPHCGEVVGIKDGLTVYHDWPKPTRQVCPGSKQNPRNPESDGRPLWNGEPNTRFAG